MARPVEGGGNSKGPCSVAFDPAEDDQPSLSIIRATAAVTGRPARALEPLATVVNVEALDAIYEDERASGRAAGAHAGAPGDDLQITFSYEGCLVTIEPTRVTVTIGTGG